MRLASGRKQARWVTACFAVGLGLLAAGGCVHYQAEPLQQGAFQARFEQRTLADPGLLAFLHTHTTISSPIAAPATQPGPPVAWDLETLTLMARYYHADWPVAETRRAAVRAALVTAGESPNPSISVAPEYSVNPDGAPPWVLAFSFDIPIETAGKRTLRVAQALAQLHAADWDLAAAGWQMRSRVRDALTEYLFEGQAVDVLTREVAARSNHAQVIEQRLRAGEAARPELDAAQIELLTARQTLRGAQGQRAEARARLAAALGVPVAALESAKFVASGGQPGMPQDDVLRALRNAALVNRLDIRRAQAEYDAAEAALQLEVAKQYPDLHISPGYTYDQGQNKYALGASLTLPIFNQNSGAIAEAAAHRRELAARFLALQAQVFAEMEVASAKLRSSLAELADANRQLAAAERQRAAGQRALELGQEDRLTLAGLDVQCQVTARLQLEARRKVEAARAALEDAVQRPLDAGALPATRPAEDPKEQQP